MFADDCCFCFGFVVRFLCRKAKKMTSETLSHQPEFELPLSGPDYPGDLLGLIEEHYEGLFRIVVHKEIRRNKYDYIAQVKCQENPGKKSRPIAPPEDICEYLMLIVQKDIDTTDLPGKYRFQIHGPPGSGSGPKKTKHIDFSDGDNIGKSVNVMDEATLLEQQGTYISELHGQVNSLIEYVTNMVQPVVQENREMMKIVTESQRRLADIEAIRLKHELELRMHADEQKRLEAEAEERHRKWHTALQHLQETGATEAIVKGVQQFIAKKQAEARAQQDRAEHREDIQTREGLREEQKEKEKRAKKPKRNRSRKANPEPESEVVETTIVEAAEEKSQSDIEREAMDAAMDMHPVVLAAQALRMTIDEKNQWELLRETLSQDQFNKFLEIFDSDDYDKSSKLLKELYLLKGVKKIMKLQEHLDKQQLTFVELLLKEAIS